jgi:uncharacterized membrane protein
MALSRSWRPPQAGIARRNISEAERWASAIAGAALAAWALQRRTRGAWVLGALSGALLYRAGTAHRSVYAASGLSTADDTSTKRALSGPGGVIVHSEVTVNRPAPELYAFWRRLETLPSVMRHLQSVTPWTLDDRRSHWVATAPLGTTVEWDAEIINDVPNRVIGWQSIEGSTVVTAGSVNFDELPDGSGTTVRVRLQYDPPAGKLGAWVARLLGEEPSVQVDEDLRRFKQLMES